MSAPKKLYLGIFLGLLCLSLTYNGRGQQTSGLQFLEIGPNSSSYGITEAHTAASIGPSNLYANPANMAFEDRSSVGVDYTIWLLDTKISHAAGTFVKENHAFGVGLVSNKINDIAARKQPGPSEGNFTVSYLSVAGAYAHQLNPSIALGITGQFLNEQYWVHQASGYAFNLGLTTRWLNDRVRVAAMLANVGEMGELNNTSTPLPTNFRFGFSLNLVQFTTPGENDLPILVKVHSDLVSPLNKIERQKYTSITEETDNPFLNFATEIEVSDLAVLRAGYQTESTTNFRQGARRISVGAGFWIQDILFNYSVITFGNGFDNAHSLGLQYYFD